MSEKLSEMLNRLSDVMHFFHLYSECNQLRALAVLLMEHDIYTVDDLRDRIKEQPYDRP